MSEKPKKETSLHSKHRARMRSRFIKGKGLDAFSPHEIVEMLLYMSYPRQDTNKIAHRVYREFGSLSALFDASPQEIMARTGLTENPAVVFSMMPHLLKYYNLEKWSERFSFDNSKEVGNFCITHFHGKINESFFIMCLNSRFQLLGVEMLEEGTLDAVELHPRKIAEAALFTRARYVVLAHNHPSGCKFISEADANATTAIIQMLEPFNVKVLDHIVVAGDSYVSFAENGVLRLEGVNPETNA